jgi:hypothetical protein
VVRYCSRCGVPRLLTAEHVWEPNGTISLSRDPGHRMVVVDNVALTNIVGSIESRLGTPVDGIVTDAKRKSGRHFMDAVLSGAKGVLIRRLASSSAYQQLAKQSSVLGLGNAEVTRYSRHRSLEGVVTDVYNGAAMAGDICGAFESVECTPAEVDHEVSADGTLSLSIRATAGAGRSEELPVISYAPGTTVPGKIILELCPVCGGPRELGKQYAFDMDRGVIDELKTGHRVVLIGMISLKSMFAELESRLGAEVPELIMAIEKDRVRDVINEKSRDIDTSAEGYLRYMRALRLRGMGNGTGATVESERVHARVDNPYYEPLIAGFLAGFYEATSGGRAQVSWTESASGSMEVTLEPALSTPHHSRRPGPSYPAER